MKTWKMRRNCALSPKQLLKCYLALVFLSVAVAAGFLLAGIKIILFFTTLELIAVTIGFLVYCRHALDFEEIEINGTRLVIRKFIAYRETVIEFNTRWAQISQPKEHEKVFCITQTGQSIEIGQFLRFEQCKRLLAELRPYLG